MGLPPEILEMRIRNELESCDRYIFWDGRSKDELLRSFPMRLQFVLDKTPGPVLDNGKVTYRYQHRFELIISSEYPFERPLVIWRTPIFHPNIMMPEDGGHVCTKLLSDWSFNSTLLTFIKGLESLLISPNGTSPFGTDTCTGAAQYFNGGAKKHIPVVCPSGPKVVRP